MSFWRTLLQTLARNPISFFAVLCVMATGVFLSYVTLRLLGILTSPEWCAKSIQAERITPGNTFVGLTSCVALTMEQVKALSTALLISISGSNFVLIVLIVVVVAGARASGKMGPTGMEFNVGKHEADKAAEHVVAGAKEAAAEVKAAPPKPDAPNLPDYAKP